MLVDDVVARSDDAGEHLNCLDRVENVAEVGAFGDTLAVVHLLPPGSRESGTPASRKR